MEPNALLRIRFPARTKNCVHIEMTQNNRTSRSQREIDDNLKRAYDDVINQNVPDRFTDLLAQLKSAESQKTHESNRGDDVER